MLCLRVQMFQVHDKSEPAFQGGLFKSLTRASQVPGSQTAEYVKELIEVLLASLRNHW